MGGDGVKREKTGGRFHLFTVTVTIYAFE